MSYTKLATQPANLALPVVLDDVTETVAATAVQLDTGDYIAVAAKTVVQANSGNPVVTAVARVINQDGTDRLDAVGQIMESQFTHTATQDDIAACGSIPEVQKRVLLAVLGEGTSPLWQDPSSTVMLDNASIRTNLASAAHAGTVNTGTLL